MRGVERKSKYHRASIQPQTPYRKTNKNKKNQYTPDDSKCERFTKNKVSYSLHTNHNIKPKLWVTPLMCCPYTAPLEFPYERKSVRSDDEQQEEAKYTSTNSPYTWPLTKNSRSFELISSFRFDLPYLMCNATFSGTLVPTSLPARASGEM